MPASGACAVVGQRRRALTPRCRPRLGQVDRIRQRPLLGQVGEVVAHTYAASRPGTSNPSTRPGAQAAWGERFGVCCAGAAWGVCHALELECLAAVVASCHGSVTLARPAPEASGQIRAIRQAGSSAASARQHDADALVLGSHLARRRPRLEALGAQTPVEVCKGLQHSSSSRGVQLSELHRNVCAVARGCEHRLTPKMRERPLLGG
jgi:hypothetical protein